MIQLHFENADKLSKGIEEISNDLLFEIVSSATDAISVTILETNDKTIEVNYKNSSATIKYGNGIPGFFRALMLLCEAINNKKTEYYVKETAYFTQSGIHLDVSRGAALNVQSIKYFIRQIALSGLNAIVMYMEDMYEVENRPYFGYSRGRYTKAEIKEICKYSDIFGVEIIPFIETFSHMGRHLVYKHTAPLCCDGTTLLADEPTTYEFLDDLIKSISEAFTSRTICIGGDEVYNANKGKYLAKHGEQPLEDVFFRHMNKVYDISKKYGLTPQMTNDMYFHLRSTSLPPSYYPCHTGVDFEDSLKNKLPDDMEKIFWNYQETDEEKMTAMMELSKKLGGELTWYGSMRMWQSLCAQYSHTITNLIVGTNACKKSGTKKAILCTWGESALVPHFFMLPAIQILAQLTYGDEYNETDIKNKVKFLYDADFNDFLQMEKADFVHENGAYEFASKYLMYNDPLIGLLDKEIEGLDLRKYYGNLVEYYKNKGVANGPLELSFKYFKCMIDVLELKADFGVRLKKAYDENDTDALRSLVSDAEIIQERMKKFLNCEREFAVKYYRGYGFEKFEIRSATIASRFETVRYRITAYLNGEFDSIIELDGERLRYDHNRFDCPNDVNIYFGTGFERAYTEA